VGVHHLDEAQQSKNFTFKCHRDNNEIYSVNSLNFHPVSFTITILNITLLSLDVCGSMLFLEKILISAALVL
jgi:hypothetical protein